MMGAKEVAVLVVLFFHLCQPASLSPLSQTLPIIHLQSNIEYKGQLGQINNAKSGENIIPHHGRKLQHAFGSRGVTGGQGAAAGGDGNGSGSHSGNPHGGGAVIPIYAAGSGKGHHNHRRGSGSCIRLSIWSSTLTATIIAYLLLKNPF